MGIDADLTTPYLYNMRLLFLLAALLAAPVLQAQELQWADTVLGYSSVILDSKDSAAYQPNKILGRPNSIAKNKSSSSGWAPKTAMRKEPEYIHVGFATPTKISLVAVYHFQTPEALTHIWAYDEQGQEHLIHQDAAPAKTKEMVFTKLIKRTPYKVASVKLGFNTSLSKGHTNVDAVGISADTVPTAVQINLVDGQQVEGEREWLSASINTEAEELLPVISPDGGTLYFVRNVAPEGEKTQQDIYFAHISDSGFSAAEPLPLPLNNQFNNAIFSISPDGRLGMLNNLYKADSTSGSGQSLAVKTDSGWSWPTKLVVEDYYNRANSGSFSMSADFQILLSSVKRSEGHGYQDLYVSFRKADSTFTKPLNLGPDINTAEGEISPFLAADNRTLYFSSDGWPGYGNKDLFVTRRLDSTWQKWSEPINLGPVVNGEGFDAYFTLPASGEYAYFSRSKKGEKADIYRVPLPESLRPHPVVLVKGRVLDAKTGKPVAADIIYEAYNDKKVAGTARSGAELGDYKIILNSGDSYGFLAQAEGYFSLNENIDLTELGAYAEVEQDLRLFPIEKGQLMRLNNVYFDYGEATLREAASLELNRIAKILTAQPALKLEVQGHTDTDGSAAFNLQLSQQRANAVLAHLTEQGVQPEQLQAKGYGEAKPVADNATEEGKQENRRVEIQVL